MWAPNLLNYYVWLIGHVHHESFENYDCLLSETWQTFYTNFSVPNDENRAADGFALRNRYASELLADLPDLGECRMLELLVGLAMRMNDVFYDWELPDQTGTYFWAMMTNLQLTQYTDEYVVEHPKSSLDDILMIFTILDARSYSKDGHGGLFPLNPNGTNHQNQREVELWYQMMSHMAEAT